MASRTTKRALVFSVIRDETQGRYAHVSIRVHEPAYDSFNREELLEAVQPPLGEKKTCVFRAVMV
jgi:hypothetical protein